MGGTEPKGTLAPKNEKEMGEKENLRGGKNGLLVRQGFLTQVSDPSEKGRMKKKKAGEVRLGAKRKKRKKLEKKGPGLCKSRMANWQGDTWTKERGGLKVSYKGIKNRAQRENDPRGKEMTGGGGVTAKRKRRASGEGKKNWVDTHQEWAEDLL